MLQALAVLEGRRGKTDAARELFERALQEDPKHVHSWQVQLVPRLAISSSCLHIFKVTCRRHCCHAMSAFVVTVTALMVKVPT